MNIKMLPKERKIDIGIGIAIGLLIGVIGSFVLGNRYELKNSGPYGIMVIKVDKWTGTTWRINSFGGQWEEIK